MCIEGNIDWDNNNSYHYLFINNYLVALMSYNTLIDYTSPPIEDKVINWDRLFLFDLNGNNLPLSQFNMSDIFTKHFPIFATAFISYEAKQKRKQIIKILSLGEYEYDFIAAQQASYSNVKLVATSEANTNLKDAINHEVRLQQIFSKHLSYIRKGQENILDGITAKHLSEIKNIFQLEDKSTEEVAVYVMCLSSVFVKYSSKNIFGTETDSSNSLREYAYALMREAYKVQPSVFIKLQEELTEATEDPSVYKDWKARLLGEEIAFSCTHTLSNMMIGYINKKYKELYPLSIIQIIPVAWL